MHKFNKTNSFIPQKHTEPTPDFVNKKMPELPEQAEPVETISPEPVVAYNYSKSKYLKMLNKHKFR